MKYDLWGAIVGSSFAVGIILLSVIHILYKYLKLKRKRKNFYEFNPEVIKELKKKHKIK